MADMIEVDESILQWALRYALGRRTYAVRDVVDSVQSNLSNLSDRFKSVAAEDIDSAERRDGLGDPNIDAPSWLALREELRRG